MRLLTCMLQETTVTLKKVHARSATYQSESARLTKARAAVRVSLSMCCHISYPVTICYTILLGKAFVMYGSPKRPSVSGALPYKTSPVQRTGKWPYILTPKLSRSRGLSEDIIKAPHPFQAYSAMGCGRPSSSSSSATAR